MIQTVYDARRIEEGLDRTGTVSLYHFDRGMVETLAASPHGSNSQLVIPGIPGPAGQCGIPVIIGNPEDVFSTDSAKYPNIVIQRMSIIPAMDRFQPGTLQYMTAAPASKPVTFVFPDGSIRMGYDRREQREQAQPYDIYYQIHVNGRYRGDDPDSPSLGQVNAILSYVLGVFPAFGCLYVRDSLNYMRTYSTFQTEVATADKQGDVGERTIGFTVEVRVEGEFDVFGPTFHTTVQSLPEVRFQVKTIPRRRP